jgi:2,3-bisphosphoglycerate-independent phosphoglycerate mutase
MSSSDVRPARGPVVLCILDGWGWREARDGNAVALARTPVFDRLRAEAPHCLLRTDGPHVGLPEGQFGNSEVGHLNLGAGRVVMQELPRIDAALADGSLAAGAPFRKLCAAAAAGSGKVHLFGLVSPGGVHAHQRHLVALARLLAERNLISIVHIVTDGRDTPPRAGLGHVGDLLAALASVRGASVATIAGRYYAMDRDRRWERTERAYRAIVEGVGPQVADPRQVLETAYAEDLGDEFVVPHVIDGYDGLGDGDAFLSCNFRADRVRQIINALVLDEFDGFARERRPRLAAVAGMTSYSADLDARLLTLSPPQELHDLMGEVVAKAGLRQLRMAETEKYPHVTFFFNGGEERQFSGEARILVPSPKVATYDLQPEMSARLLTARFVAAFRDDPPDFTLINFANPDMVGHTGNLAAAIEAVETVDACLGEVVGAVEAAGGAILITADHGNCEVMIDPDTGGPHTAHTTNPVPCLLIGGPAGGRLRPGRLADVAPTLLGLLGVPQPPAMTGHSLLDD